MSGGVASALTEVLEGSGTGETLAQAGLFDLGEDETGALDAPSPLSAALIPKGGKGGRPKGARNRRTEAVIGWLLSQHRHPLSVMAEAYSMTPAQLAERIGIANPDADQLLDLLKLQLRMAEAVAPYVAQKLPQAVTVDGAALLQVSFAGLTLPGGVSSPARAAGPGNSDALDGDALGVKLAVKSDDPAG